jgi:hypothetical protein
MGLPFLSQEWIWLILEKFLFAMGFIICYILDRPLKKENWMQNYQTIDRLLKMLKEPEQSICRKILADIREYFPLAPGASKNHQAWPGGYLDHVQEVMNLGYEKFMFYMFQIKRPLPFAIHDILLVLFLHDLEKPWKYGPEELRVHMPTKKERLEFKFRKIAEYGIVLTPMQENGIRYIEGEGDDYSPEGPVMSKLAALCHECDTASARIYPEYPLSENDPWQGARRSVPSAPPGNTESP